MVSCKSLESNRRLTDKKNNDSGKVAFQLLDLFVQTLLKLALHFGLGMAHDIVDVTLETFLNF